MRTAVQIVLLLHIEQGHTQHRAIGCYQGQEDAKDFIHEAGLELADDHFSQLHDHGYDEDEAQRRQVFKTQRLEQVTAQQDNWKPKTA